MNTLISQLLGTIANAFCSYQLGPHSRCGGWKVVVILSLSLGVRQIQREFKEQGGRSHNCSKRAGLGDPNMTFSLATAQLTLINFQFSSLAKIRIIIFLPMDHVKLNKIISTYKKYSVLKVPCLIVCHLFRKYLLSTYYTPGLCWVQGT